MSERYGFQKWFIRGIGVKRWLLLFALSIAVLTISLALALLKMFGAALDSMMFDLNWIIIGVMIGAGFLLAILSLLRLSHNILAPYRRHQQGDVIDVVVQHSKLHKGTKLVAIGGGTGLPAALHGMKHFTSNITAIVTVADDGGSSGRLRRDMGVLPPGDLRNNIVALADDESLLTRLFQYRFQSGDLQGHAFGNLFIAALASIVAEDDGDKGNSLARALVEAERILNIQGRVLPATLDEVYLTGTVRLTSGRTIKIKGESQIEHMEGHLESIQINPPDVTAYPESVQAILNADIVVLGPGSLYTSILPNLLVKGVADALRATNAYKIYICNVATQPVETQGYDVADHVMALEKHIGRGVFQAVLANNAYPTQNAGKNTRYVKGAASNHEILQRYEVRYTDLTDTERPWRHDPYKLAAAILDLTSPNEYGVVSASNQAS